MFDMTSLLLGAAISGTGLGLAMLSLWANDRESRYKVNWSIGAGILVAHVLAYWFFAHGAPLVVGALAAALQPLGAAFLYASVRQFLDERAGAPRIVAAASVLYLLVVPAVFAAGYDGIALVVQNAMTATLLTLGGIAYMRHHHEAPLAISTLAMLYLVAGASFAACGLVIFLNGQWSIGYPPQNWAEELNTIVSVLTISMAGALTLAIDQTRLAKRNQLSAMSDPMTGLLNRRGLQSVHRGLLGEEDAVILFDLDNFKQVNDRYGHPVGDHVIRTFANVVRQHGRSADHKARLGGEEFALVMDGVTAQQARVIAERVASAFSGVRMHSEQGEPFFCTVSGGIAFGAKDGSNIEDVMARADTALYAAKREGRNRVEAEWPANVPDLRLVG